MASTNRFANDHTAKRKTAHLYEVLELDKKTATEDDIKKAYRKLALQYHPDKNLNGDISRTEKFKEINHAHTILSNPQKKKIYDEYGDFGLKMMDQLGEERMAHMSALFSPWVKWLCGALFCLTGGCFACFCCCCCGFQCCCNFCCGKYKPKEEDFMDHAEYNNIVVEERDTQDDPIVIQPAQTFQNTQQSTPIVLGPPPSSSPPPNYGATSGASPV